MTGYRRETVRIDDLDLALHIADGQGRPFLLQHGLGGDAAQPAEVAPEGAGWTHHVLECRGHGASDAGDPAGFSIAQFTDDLAETIESRRLAPCPVGGISMGAAIALRLAVTRPDLVSALILARPAWLTEAGPDNLAPNAEAGRVIAEGGNLETFLDTETARTLARVAPDNLTSIEGFFAREPRETTAELLTRISADGAGVTEAQIRALTLPTLILGTGEDVVHPMALAEAFDGLIPGARLVRLTPKGRDRAAHTAEFKAALAAFLKELP